jgi:hypothetical protein
MHKFTKEEKKKEKPCQKLKKLEPSKKENICLLALSSYDKIVQILQTKP